MNLPEDGDRPVEASEQDQLVLRFCEHAREALRGAPDKQSAVAMADDICRRFSEECASEMVVKATRSYLDRWIDERWEGQTP